MVNSNLTTMDVLLSIAGVLAFAGLLFERSQWRASGPKVRVFWAATGGVGLASLVNQALRQERGWGWGMGTGGALLVLLCAVAALILVRKDAPRETATAQSARIRPWTLGLLLLGDAALVAGAGTASIPAKALLVLGGCALLVAFTQLRRLGVQGG